jgi:dihydrofolate reductase
MLTLIAAHDRNGAIGSNGTLPWRAPGDLASFQRETLGGALIMGRKTWESLPRRPLPDRLNIVVSATDMEGAVMARTPGEALTIARNSGYHRVYAAGGAGIYAALLPHAQRLALTEVDVRVENADTFLPRIDMFYWQLISRSVVETTPHCLMREYIRKVPA